MKTALQKLIDRWEQEKGSFIPNGPIFQQFINDAKEMLEEEENIINEAYASGLKRGAEFERGYQSKILQEWPIDFDYYDQTFNDEK